MIQYIRPHIVLDRVPEEKRNITFLLPNRFSHYLVFETMVLLALEQIVWPKKIFEFGTFLGETTFHFSLNGPEDVQVITLDLGACNIETANLDTREWALADYALTNKPYFVSRPESTRITQIFGNSKTIDLSPYFRSCQFVYIDGGHTIDVIEADTENAFKMLNKEKPSVIVWHDYGNPNYPDVKKYLSTLAKKVPIYSICETRIVFYMEGLLL